jgi:hypothetical protein
MNERINILNKIKLLLTLASSDNENEASNAQKLADALIKKHSITQEELESLTPKEYYNENSKLLEVREYKQWIPKLVAAIAFYLDIYPIEEVYATSTGEQCWVYYFSGAENSVQAGKVLFSSLHQDILNMISLNSLNKDESYIVSYYEGLIDGLKEALAWQKSSELVPTVVSKKLEESEQEPGLIPTNTIEKQEEHKPKIETKPIQEASIVIDPVAYFKGLDDGYRLRED